MENHVAYIDTDSIYSTNKLLDNYVGKGLGLMKDELEGNIIQEAYFLGIKKYGYWLIDDNNKHVSKSVFAGVTRNSLDFYEVKDIFNGKIVTKEIPIRFYKSFKDFSIITKSTKVSIIKSLDKPLVNNNYIPLNIMVLSENLEFVFQFLYIFLTLYRYQRIYHPNLYNYFLLLK